MSEQIKVGSFLYFSVPDYHDPGIPKTTLDDSRISELISTNVNEILHFPCEQSLIKARQEIFKEMMQKGDFYAKMLSLKSSLVSLDSCEGGRRLSVTNAQKAFKTVKMLETFLECTHKIKSLVCDSMLIENTVSLWNDENGEFVKELENDTRKAREMIDSIGYVNMRLDNTGYTLSVEKNNDNYVDRLTAISREFNVRTPQTNEMSLKCDRSISDAAEKFYPELFSFLYGICEKYRDIPEGELFSIKREIDFYLEIMELVRKAGERNIPYAFPEVSKTKKFTARNAYDISLMVKNSDRIVPNDISFEGETDFCFLTGANGGGKTTYLRTVAINLVLAVTGCPVFADKSSVYSYDRILTHFPADERFGDTGRLVEEEQRIDEMLNASSEDSFLLFNETFSGTDDVKGCRLTLDAVEKLRAKKASGLFITHFHEVSASGLPMLGAVVDSENENARTYKIVFKKGGRNSSYANDILRKYRLDKESIDARISEIKEV